MQASEILSFLKTENNDILDLLKKSNSVREDNNITFSKNVFIPITYICRNTCGYCTFKKEPSEVKDLLMSPDQIMKDLVNADDYGCKEALFTFGERSDEVDVIQDQLDKMNYDNMIEYLYHISKRTLKETDLLPHTNCGIISKSEMKTLREVNASMGLMLENSSPRLMETPAHELSPGKDPKLRIKLIENAGKLKIPFTTGLLIGIGETIEERVESLLELRRIQDKYGHIQEIIIQNFRSKPGIPMENHPEPSFLEILKMVAISSLLFPDVSIQVPPNLNSETTQMFLLAGADDWGGVSPVSKDFVNPEAPWPEIEKLKAKTAEVGFNMVERLPVYKKYINSEFLSSEILEKIDIINSRYGTEF